MVRHPGAVTHKELTPVSATSLAHNQTGPTPCRFCGAPAGVSCLEHYVDKHGLPFPSIEDVADSKLQHQPFIEIAAPEGVRVGEC